MEVSVLVTTYNHEKYIAQALDSVVMQKTDFDFEIVIKLLRKGYRPLELPVNYSARSFSEGKKVTVFRDPLTWLRALMKYRNSPLYGLSVPEDPAHW